MTSPLAVSSCRRGELDPVCPIERSKEIVAGLGNAEVTFERIPGASHGDANQPR